MGYSQWVTINIKNLSQKTLVIRDVRLSDGKFYKDGDMDTEIPIEVINDTKILPTATYTINSCGRYLAPNGTQGQFDIYTEDHRVRHFYWNCPFWYNTNTWTISSHSEEWIVDDSGANYGPGALGNITVKLSRKQERLSTDSEM